MSKSEKQKKLPAELIDQLRLIIEFHLWGNQPEGVTDRDTVYENNFSRLRSDTMRLQRLCDSVENSLRGSLPSEAATLLAAGRMYRRSADYVKAGEYFFRALEVVYRECQCA